MNQTNKIEVSGIIVGLHKNQMTGILINLQKLD